jgi:hypothetical protein
VVRFSITAVPEVVDVAVTVSLASFPAAKVMPEKYSPGEGYHSYQAVRGHSISERIPWKMEVSYHRS